VGRVPRRVILTAVLVCLIFALIDGRNQAPLANMGPLLIGVLIAAIGFAFGQNSGWADPARDFGPRLFQWIAGYATAWKDEYGSIYFWVPIVGPLIGGALGATSTTSLSGSSCPAPSRRLGSRPSKPGVARPATARRRGSSTRRSCSPSVS
jgi:glycerol uptake facilitator protein